MATDYFTGLVTVTLISGNSGKIARRVYEQPQNIEPRKTPTTRPEGRLRPATVSQNLMTREAKDGFDSQGLINGFMG